MCEPANSPLVTQKIANEMKKLKPLLRCEQVKMKVLKAVKNMHVPVPKLVLEVF